MVVLSGSRGVKCWRQLWESGSLEMKTVISITSGGDAGKGSLSVRICNHYNNYR